MKIRNGILMLALAILSLAMSEPKKANFDFDYSLSWIPFYSSSLEISIKNKKAYLITITYADARRTGKMADFIAGPFSPAEFEKIKKQSGKLETTTDLRRLYTLVKNKSLFVVATKGTYVNLYKSDSRWFEFWRLWHPHWIFVADFKDLAPEQQIRFMEDKYDIKGWIDY